MNASWLFFSSQILKILLDNSTNGWKNLLSWKLFFHLLINVSTWFWSGSLQYWVPKKKEKKCSTAFRINSRVRLSESCDKSAHEFSSRESWEKRENIHSPNKTKKTQINKEKSNIFSRFSFFIFRPRDHKHMNKFKLMKSLGKIVWKKNYFEIAYQSMNDKRNVIVMSEHKIQSTST